MILLSKTLPQFWSLYDELSENIRRQADKQYALFTHNPFHPSLRLKQIGPFWSVRVSRSYRALALREGDIFTWVWIGSHDAYKRFLGSRR